MISELRYIDLFDRDRDPSEVWKVMSDVEPHATRTKSDGKNNH